MNDNLVISPYILSFITTKNVLRHVKIVVLIVVQIGRID